MHISWNLCTQKILKFISHVLILVRCKIQQLDVQKEQVSKKNLCNRNDYFECFLKEKKSHGPSKLTSVTTMLAFKYR